MSEAPSAWKELEQSTRPSTGSQMCIETEGGVSTKYVWRFWITQRAVKVVGDVYDESGKWQVRNVYCYNPQYAFVARQSVEGGPYFLRQYGRDKETIADVRMQIFTRRLIMFTPTNMSKLLHDKSFDLISARHVVVGGRNLVEVEFQSVPTGIAARWDPSVHDSRIVFDPVAKWRIVSSIVTSKKLIAKMEITYAAGGAVGDVARIQDEATAPGSRVPFQTSVREFTSVSHEPIAEKEFYLNSVGLPEVREAVSGGWSWRWMLIGNGLILFVVLAFLVHRWYHRRDHVHRAE